MAELTPMMKQYKALHAQHPDCLLFFRLGDFYEMFDEDARVASKELDLALTTRDRGKSAEEQTPMCGVPFHSAEGYIARLVAKGYKVAICEQMEDPALAKGLVERDVIRIITPATVVESSMLDESSNNYYASLCQTAEGIGVALIDISTGEACATLSDGEDARDKAFSELGRFEPKELIVDEALAQGRQFALDVQVRLHCPVNVGKRYLYEASAVSELLAAQFAGQDLSALPQPTQLALGALVQTLRDLQKSDLHHVSHVEYYLSGRYLELDPAARRNLELTRTLRGKEKRGSLLWVMDKTKTPMGSRMLRAWMEKPLRNPNEIRQRLDAVKELFDGTLPRQELLLTLKTVTDLERITARIVTGVANARDLVQLSQGSAGLPALKGQLSRFQSSMLAVIADGLDDLHDLRKAIDETIADEPPFSLREGGLIRPGCSEEVDRLREIMSGGKGTLTRIEAAEKEKTGIKNLRVGYNRVFGYYIEVAKGQVDLVPDTYIRKQTLVNGERYITQELKELENTILGAKDRLNALEYELFTALRDQVAANAERIQRSARAIAAADVLCCFAELAVQNNYCMPEVDLSSSISITAGRHPVVEKTLTDAMFVPNDTRMDGDTERVALITGPNMAGKSTYMRQVALIVLMAQMGSFVPASAARIGVVDKLFTRIGASDDLAAGQSTFLVEMSEMAEILKHATPRSLLILDEIGRGTATYDGMAIAQAVLEHVCNPLRLGCKTLFATHYHELTHLEKEKPEIHNYNICVKRRKDDIVFLRKIVPGIADGSFGIEVAKLAGLPPRVVNRAREILKELEENGPSRIYVPVQAPRGVELPMLQTALGDPTAEDLKKRIEDLAVDTMTPIEALNTLYELKQMLVL
ncbi:MAG: DNA mismatch repair protein MutS [Oscillospiraceae bacterium]|nr:DNA mismatch repair protein MutS [Oscillospiraceae bacterium]